jgi:hypothetical protein
MNHKKLLISILLVSIIVFSIWFAFALSPTRTAVDNFLKDNSCSPSALETDYSSEYECAAYMRRHTTLLGGQIISVPKFTFLFVYTPFHYFNYIEPNTSDYHVYVFVITSDQGTLVYNPVNGKYIGRYDDLLQNMKNIS